MDEMSDIMADSPGSDTAAEGACMPDQPPYPGTPRWVKLLAIVVLVFVLVVAVIALAGPGSGHGPGRHLSAGGLDGHTQFVERPGQRP